MYVDKMNRSRDGFRIRLEDQFLPVQAFFNAFHDGVFFEILEGFSERYGSWIEDSFCSFPGEIEAHEKPLDGIRFYLFDEVVDISNMEFVSLLEVVCESYLDDNPTDRKHVESLFARVQDTLLGH